MGSRITDYGLRIADCKLRAGSGRVLAIENAFHKCNQIVPTAAALLCPLPTWPPLPDCWWLSAVGVSRKQVKPVVRRDVASLPTSFLFRLKSQFATLFEPNLP